MTNGTAFDIDAGEAPHQCRDRFRRPGRRGGEHGEELAAPGELGLASAIGEQPEVADAHEAIGDDVEQEAADELGRLQRHHLEAVAVGVILPPEVDDAVSVADEPFVGERDAVGIAAEVVEDLIGAGQRLFGIDHPGGFPQVREPGREGGGRGQGRGGSGEAELAGGKRAPEGGQVFAAEDLSEGPDGEEEARRRRNPARAVAREGAARDDAVDVQVLGEVLPPGCAGSP